MTIAMTTANAGLTAAQMVLITLLIFLFAALVIALTRSIIDMLKQKAYLPAAGMVTLLVALALFVIGVLMIG